MNRSSRILLILNNYYDENMPSRPEIMAVFGLNLPEIGYIVEWILPYRIGVFHRIITKKFYEAKLNLIPCLKAKNSVTSLFCLLYYPFRVFFLAANKIKEEKINFLVISDNTLAGLMGLILRKFFNIPLIFNYSFPFGQGAKDAYKEGNIGVFKFLFYQIEALILKNIVLKNSDFILPISSRMENQLKQIGIKKSQMLPFPLGIEPRLFKLNPDNSNIRKKLSISEKDFILTYVGSITKIRGLEIIIDTFKEITKQIKNAKLILIGDGDGLNNLKNLVDENTFEKIIFTGRISYFDVPNYLDISDVGLSIIKPLPCYDVSSPCKLFEYMMIGKPIIANEEIPEHKEVLTDCNCGILVKYDKTSLSDAMIELATLKQKDKKAFLEMGLKGHRWVIKNRTFQKMAMEIHEKFSEGI